MKLNHTRVFTEHWGTLTVPVGFQVEEIVVLPKVDEVDGPYPSRGVD